MIALTEETISMLFVGILFTILGLLFAVKPDWLIKFQIWQQEKMMGAKYIPSKKTYTVTRAMGIIFLIMGIITLLFAL